MSTRLGAVLAGLGAALLLTGRVAGLPLATHSVALTMLTAGCLLLGYSLSVAPRRNMIRNLNSAERRPQVDPADGS